VLLVLNDFNFLEAKELTGPQSKQMPHQSEDVRAFPELIKKPGQDDVSRIFLVDATEFVTAIRRHCAQAAEREAIGLLTTENAYQKSRPAVKSAQAWFEAMSEDDRNCLKFIISEAVDSATFGLLCVVDGVRVIEETVQKSEFELVCVSPDANRTVLNDDELLHDIYKSLPEDIA